MPSQKNTVARKVQINDSFKEFLDNLYELMPFSLRIDPFMSVIEKDKCSNAFTIYIRVGREFKADDIHASVEKGKLKLTGKCECKDEHGSSCHEFTKEYDLPKDIESNTMKTELDQYGGLRVTFNRKCKDQKPEFEDLSNKNQYHIVLRVDGYDPSDFSIITKGKLLIIEAKHSKQEESPDGSSHYHESGTYRRSLIIEDDVDEETLKAKYNKDGSLDITAKKDPKKAKQEEKKISIDVDKKL